jgi:phospholipid/cholesterol/gamma-HCH transport system substrate-binding protein
MSVTRAQKVRLGIFVVVSTTLLIAMALVLLGGKLARKEDTYFALFDETVSGLEIGAPVKFHGVRIGSVTSIEIDHLDVTKVRVNLDLQRGTPVKEDTTVVLNSMGITGLKFLELTGGTNESNLLEPGSEIQSDASLLDRLSGRADVIVEKLELLLNNALAITGPEQQEQVKQILGNVQELLEETNDLLTRNEARIDQVMDDLAVTTSNLKEASVAANGVVQRADGQVVSILSDVERLVWDFEQVVADQNYNLSTLINDADSAVLSVNELLTSPSVRRLPRQAEETVAAVLTLVRNADGRVGGLLGTLQSTAVRLKNLLDDERVEKMFDSLSRLSVKLEGLVDTLDLTTRQAREDIFKTLANLKDVVRNLNDFTQMLLENPSILLRGSQLKERKL